MTLKECADLNNLLRAWRLRTDDLVWDFISEQFQHILRLLPEVNISSAFSVPLINVLQLPREYVHLLLLQIEHKEYQDAHLFSKWRDILWLNVCNASNTDPKHPKKLIEPTDSTLPLDQLVKTYLRGTPFEKLLLTPVPLKLTNDVRMSHMHILGGTGAGKTTLIQHLLLNDFKSPTKPSIVLIDPHSDLIHKLFEADIGIANRVIMIDPREIDYPPALNVFAPSKRFDNYSQATKEQVSAGVIQTLEYLFAGFGIEMTGKQQVLFRNVCRLMLYLPVSMGRNATILDMLRILDDPTPYKKAIEGLPEIPREFFARDFPSKSFLQTKEQIRYRLQAILENPTIARLFTSEDTKIDLYDELNNGSIILVDAAKDFLKTASSTFGRIFISLTLQAVLERAVTDQRHDTFLMVDEAGSFFSENIDDLLVEARKYRCGLVLAHQYLDQATPSLRASLSANTAIKMASGLSASDARNMAQDMRTTPDFILSEPALHFACHIRNVTPQAVTIPLSIPKPLPIAPDQELIARFLANRERVAKITTPVKNPIGFGVDLAEVDDDRQGPRIGFHREDGDDFSSTW